MEFPHIGKNCSFASCNKLDFLPMKCGACKEVFCAPVPGRRGEPPDVAVSAHIDNQCTSDRAKERRNKVFINRCSYKGCKTKEMVPLVCAECSLNYCLRHRHTTDHACEGKLAAKRRQAAEAAMARMKSRTNGTNNISSQVPVTSFAEVQGNMTEDEALAHALALSLQEGQSTVNSRDTAFARALARQRVGGEQNSRCSVS